MNPVDLIALLLVVLAVILGFRSGALPQVGGLAGAIGGAALVILLLPSVEEQVASLDPTIRPFAVLAGLLLGVAIGETIGSAVGRIMARNLGGGVLGAMDQVGGAVVGAAQALLIIWLAGGLIAISPLTRMAEAAQTSTAVRTMAAVLPPPGEFATNLGRLLDDTGLPDVFIGFEPLPAPDVERPDDPEARAIAAAAEASTVKVSAQTCGLGSVGTGFAIAPGYVVTNAHVVAGARPSGVRVTTLDGRSHDAAAVFFDPDVDVAVLLVDQLAVPPLRFASHDPERGTLGAALGYPGGGHLTVVPAAVAGRYPATGRDIYGEDRVRREILELRAEIDRGDSGGPLVLRDGTVGGVVFAEARTEEEVGYALTPTAVSVLVAPAIGRTGAVDTGPCLVG